MLIAKFSAISFIEATNPLQYFLQKIYPFLLIVYVKTITSLNPLFRPGLSSNIVFGL